MYFFFEKKIDKRTLSCYINVIASEKSYKHLKKQKKTKNLLTSVLQFVILKGL